MGGPEERRIACIVLLAVSLTCGLVSARAHAEEGAGDPASSAELLATADAQMEAGDVAGAAQNYVQLLNQHPEAPEVHQVHANMGAICNEATEAELDAVEAALPTLDTLSCFDSKFLIGCFHYGRYLRARDVGDTESARGHFEKTCQAAWNVMWDHPDKVTHATVVEKVFGMAQELGQTETDAVVARLMQAVTELGSCPATWSAKAVLREDPPTLDSFTAAEDKFAVCEFYQAWAEQAKELGEAPEVAEYYTKARDAAWTLMWEYPSHAAQICTVQTYLESAQGLGEAAGKAAAAQLQAALDSAAPSMTAWAGRFALSALFPQFADGAAGLPDQYAALLAQRDAPFITETLGDPGVALLDKAWIEYAIGLLLQKTKQYDAAKARYTTVLEKYPSFLEPVAAADFGLAWITCMENSGEVSARVAALQGYIDRHPAGPYADWALLKIGDVYRESGDPDAAKAVYEQVIDKYPEFDDVILAAQNGLAKCSDS